MEMLSSTEFVAFLSFFMWFSYSFRVYFWKLVDLQRNLVGDALSCNKRHRLSLVGFGTKKIVCNWSVVMSHVKLWHINFSRL